MRQRGATITIVSTRCIAVTGMTCGDPLPGDASLREAVEEAGYEFAG